MTPTLIIAGAQKSASTSVLEWFDADDGVIQFGGECLAFEGRAHVLATRRLRWRVAREEGRQLVAVLKRPEILHNQVVRRRAAATFPGAVTIVVLRHPTDRAVSAWRHYRRLGLLDPGSTVGDCVRRWHETGPWSIAGQIIAYSRYAAAVGDLLGRFPSSTVAFHEETVADPRRALAPAVARLPLRGELPARLPARNTRTDGDRVGPHPSRRAGRLAYRWDEDTGLLVRRPLPMRAVAHALALVGRRHEPAVTEGDRVAVHDAVVDDLGRLEDVLCRPVPAQWRDPLPRPVGS